MLAVRGPPKGKAARAGTGSHFPCQLFNKRVEVSPLFHIHRFHTCYKELLLSFLRFLVLCRWDGCGRAGLSAPGLERDGEKAKRSRRL